MAKNANISQYSEGSLGRRTGDIDNVIQMEGGEALPIGPKSSARGRPSGRPKKQVLTLLWCYLAFVALIGTLHVAGNLALWVVGGLIVWSLRGAKQSVQALSITVVIRFLNPSAFSIPYEVSLLSWLLLLIVFVRHVPLALAKTFSVVAPLWLFCGFTAVLTIASSSIVVVSLMKLLAFFVGATAVLVIFGRLQAQEIKFFEIWFCALYAAIVTTSIATIPFPNLAYALNEVGLQGILSHPQTFGAMLAPPCCWAIANVLHRKAPLFSVSTAVAAILIVLIVMTQTRTALLAVILGILSTSVAFVFGQRHYGRVASLKGSIAKISAGVVILVLLAAMVTPIQTAVQHYVYKRESRTLDEALASRSGGVRWQWQNFTERPIAGHGFGVYPGKQFAKDVRTFMGIPISAPVEKGFLPTALLEEVGILGGFWFVLFVVALSRMVIYKSDIRWVAVMFSCLFVNLGEAVFFSVGGIGMHYWLLIGLASVIRGSMKGQQAQ